MIAGYLTRWPAIILQREEDTDMFKSERPKQDARMIITVQGREVAMQFAEKPNPQVALQVKQALMGNYLAASSKKA